MGAGNRTFRVYKFRTMVADAEDRKADIVHLNMHNGGDDADVQGAGGPTDHPRRDVSSGVGGSTSCRSS